MANLLDNLLKILWELIFFFCGVIAFLSKGASKLLLGLFFEKSRRRTISSFCHSNAEFIRKFGYLFQKKIKQNIVFRRIISIVFLIILFLYYFPPSTWGRWHKYEEGIASYYGWGFYCRASASGEIYWPWKYAAAHKTLPIGTMVKVKNLDNGRTIYVRIFDRGPFVKCRIIDLTKRAGHDLGIVENGLAKVEIYTK
jgi:rare lipoprotein A